MGSDPLLEIAFGGHNEALYSSGNTGAVLCSAFGNEEEIMPVKMHAFNRVQHMSTPELRAWIESAISRCKDDETREILGSYIEGFFNDWVSLAELACDIRDSVYYDFKTGK
jgi:hypothetical protein